MGAGTHKISFESLDSCLGNLTVPNEAKIQFANLFNGYRLTQDLTISGDTKLDGGTLDLNSHTLTIEGDFTNLEGTINTNSGTLVVKGNYISKSNLQNNGAKISSVHVYRDLIDKNGTIDLKNIEMNVAGNIEQTGGSIIPNGGALNTNGNHNISDNGGLCMSGRYAAGSVNVGQDFKISNNVKAYNISSNDLFRRGTLAIGGDFYQYNGTTVTCNFYSYDSHVVKFVGAGMHTINSESVETKMSKIYLSNGSSLCFAGNLNGINNINTTSSIESDTNSFTINKANGSITGTELGNGVLTFVGNSGTKSDINVTIEKPIVPGNISMSGELNVLDVVYLQKYILSLSSFRQYQWELADINRDGTVDVFDLGLLKRLLINSK